MTQPASDLPETRPNPFSAADVAEILLRRGWLAAEHAGAAGAWLEQAALLLGPQSADRAALEDLLSLVFEYDAATLLRRPENHAVLAREWSSRVLRQLAHLLLEGPAVDSERFKELINVLKERLTARSRELFHPLRLALAGRAGEGELDRVILLLDAAAQLPFSRPVKGTRARIVEFCAALD